jgi:hypothetical protein
MHAHQSWPFFIPYQPNYQLYAKLFFSHDERTESAFSASTADGEF